MGHAIIHDSQGHCVEDDSQQKEVIEPTAAHQNSHTVLGTEQDTLPLRHVLCVYEGERGTVWLQLSLHVAWDDRQLRHAMPKILAALTTLGLGHCSTASQHVTLDAMPEHSCMHSTCQAVHLPRADICPVRLFVRPLMLPACALQTLLHCRAQSASSYERLAPARSRQTLQRSAGTLLRQQIPLSCL